MTITEHIKSAGVTNSDASPRVANTAGDSGGPGHKSSVDGSATVANIADTSSDYRLVRVPWNAIVKNVRFASDAQGNANFDIGVAYAPAGPDAPRDPDLAGDTIDADLFASAVNCDAAFVLTDVTFESGQYSKAEIFQPLWQAAGLSADPGGKADIMAFVQETVTTGTGVIYLQVDYVTP